MFAVDVAAPDRTTRRHVVASHRGTLGSSEGCEILIPGALPRHARIVVDPRTQWLWFEPLGPVLRGDTPCADKFAMTVDERIVIADHVVRLIDVSARRFEASYGAIDAAEAALVDAIIGAEEASRLVYADWLDDRADPRAALVRELESGAAPDLDQLARLIPTNVRWRARVLQSAIEGCNVKTGCPGHWGAVEQRAGRADLRTCRTCTKLVLYAVDPQQAKEHLQLGGTVVIDALALRWPGDLG
jgi:uncharacterized protein (TIGR02996 family)